ncbi:BON domain-containing protein [Paraburkholderia sp. BL6665CI2N2]|uniref:BON domain-containing protein n=1 Tax=Paraburkholderia sp. BL6665CI2N2 TaxID=1938806 RepID=UPI0010647605|nr:BON domain-containing protein [Paraburkholderia sp. BL6665CI2N2]TDY21553.1 BON domain-containing protein [Paraburkholderia sp. BL6665CI2N2]
MKAMNGLRMALGVAIAVASIGVWAQGGASASAGEAVTASGGTTAKGARQANRALRRTVYAALAKHKEIDAGDISITAKGGAVMISGTVPDASQISTVTEVAKSVPGVTAVTSKVTLQRPFGQ